MVPDCSGGDAMSLNGKVALVTGASRGLGEGAARALAKAGAKVMLVARDGALVHKVAGEIGGGGPAREVAGPAAVAQGVAAPPNRVRGLATPGHHTRAAAPTSQI